MDIYSKLHSEIASRQEEMANDINSYVALYNIKDRKAFFFMTNEEARHAMNYISDKRKNVKSDLFMMEYKLANLIAKSVNKDGEVCFDQIKKRIVNIPFNGDSITPQLLNSLFAEVEGKDKTLTSLFMHALRFADIRSFGKEVWDGMSMEDVRDYGVYGKLFTANIRIVNNIKNTVILAASLANKNKDDDELVEFHLTRSK